MKLVKIENVYTNSKGENVKGYNFYLILENGNSIPIKASFKDGYGKLNVIAEEIKKGD